MPSKVTIKSFGKVKSEVWDFRDTCDPAFLVLVAEDEDRELEIDRRWRDDLLALFGATTKEEAAAVLERIEPIDAAECVRALSSDPEGGAFFRALSATAAPALSVLPPTDPANDDEADDDDEADFWLALDDYRAGRVDGLTVFAVLSRPALRGRQDLRADFDRLAKLKGDL